MTRTLTRLMINRPLLTKIAWLTVITLVALVVASCGDQSGGGMWQGGNDSSPSWR